MKKRVLIIGGLGFIGKNLYKRLIASDYPVSILAHRIEAAQDSFLTADVLKDVILGSFLDSELLETLVGNYEVIFSLAGNSGASDSITYPYRDLEVNLRGHLTILEACRKKNPGVKLIFPSSRLVYGKPLSNPVGENHPLYPDSIYAIHKFTTEQYYLLYQRLYNINSIIFRIANPYGYYQKIDGGNYGILNLFIHKAIRGIGIDIFGDGSQLRDFIYIDDLTDLFEIIIHSEKCNGQVYNVGSGEGIALRDTVELIQKNIPQTIVNYRPWPTLEKKIETGDYISDIRKLSADMGWEPKTKIDEGIAKTIQFYLNKM